MTENAPNVKGRGWSLRRPTKVNQNIVGIVNDIIVRDMKRAFEDQRLFLASEKQNKRSPTMRPTVPR